MINALRKLLEHMKDFPAKLHTARNADIEISGTASIGAYRRISLKHGSRLKIGDNSIIQGSIITEHPEAEVIIGSRTFIGGSRVISASKIIIGDDVLISWGCTIVDHDSHSISWSKRSSDVLDWAEKQKNWHHVTRGLIHIQNKVWIGANVIVLKNTTVGEGAVIGTGSVVTKNVPAWTVVGGNPAKVIRSIPDDER